MAGVDGLRALAVTAVVLYHQNTGWARGGFLGVEVFFVVSGYLITSLLLAEWRDSGGIRLRTFWARRARRLLPPLVAMLAVVMLAALLFVPDSLSQLRGDTLSALGYVGNWWMIFHHQSYFVHMGRPPLLEHLWSLGVEEQFYLCWPLVLVGGLRLFRGGKRFLLATALAGAAGSTLLMAVMAHPYTDNSRVYYGTDTRGSGLLLGAALALVLTLPRTVGRDGVAVRAASQMAGVAGLIVLGWSVLHLGEFDPRLYRGGFLLVDLATLAVIVGVLHPAAALGRLLGVAPLRWLGTRSYAVYLWHWPVFMLTRPGLDVATGGSTLLALRVAATLTLAELSYRLVERPFREKRSDRVRVPERQPALRVALPPPVRRHRPPVGVMVVVAGWLIVAAAWPAASHPSAAVSPPSKLAASASPLVRPMAFANTPDPPRLGRDRAATPALLAPVPPTPAPTTPPPPPPPARVTALGDSVMLDARVALQREVGSIDVDAVVGRQFSSALADVRSRLAAGQIGQEVILGLGTNGPISPHQFDQMMSLLSGVRRVVVVNVRVPRPWESEVNSVDAAGVHRWANAVLVDWHTASAAHPELFSSDGTHLGPAGGLFYASLVVPRL